LNPVEAGSPACLSCHRRRRRRLAQVFLAVDLNRGEEDGEEDRPEEESDQPVGRQAAEDAEEEEQHRQLGLFPDEHREKGDRKSTRLNSSHGSISYAVFCLKKKNINTGSNQTTKNYTPD